LSATFPELILAASMFHISRFTIRWTLPQGWSLL